MKIVQILTSKAKLVQKPVPFFVKIPKKVQIKYLLYFFEVKTYYWYKTLYFFRAKRP